MNPLKLAMKVEGMDNLGGELEVMSCMTLKLAMVDLG